MAAEEQQLELLSLAELDALIRRASDRAMDDALPAAERARAGQTLADAMQRSRRLLDAAGLCPFFGWLGLLNGCGILSWIDAPLSLLDVLTAWDLLVVVMALVISRLAWTLS